MSDRRFVGRGGCKAEEEGVRLKMWEIVSRHEQLKISFNQLNSHIRSGLLEAEDVFASLAIPLTKLVGLKTVEMATEGRFTTITTTTTTTTHNNSINHSSSDEDYMNKAMTAGHELMEKQKLHLIQLINILRQIEAQVNHSQNTIVQTLADNRAFIKEIFLKAATYVSAAIHHSNHNNELSHMMLKLLKAMFDHVGVAFNSVEGGIDDLISQLANKMCDPMVNYVNGLKVEMKTGTQLRLLEVVEEMDEAMKIRKSELEEARKQARLAEKDRIEALSKLEISEEKTRKMTISLRMLTEDSPTTSADQNLTLEKSLSLKEDKVKDDNLLWELLKKKRKCQVPDSPVGPNELLGIGPYNNKLKVTRTSPSVSHMPVTRSRAKGLNLQSSSINSRLLLGCSPTSTIQKNYNRKYPASQKI